MASIGCRPDIVYFFFVFLSFVSAHNSSCSTNEFNVFKVDGGGKVVCSTNDDRPIVDDDELKENRTIFKLLYSEIDRHIMLVELTIRQHSIITVKIDELDVSYCRNTYESKKSSAFPILKRIIPPACTPINRFFLTQRKLIVFRMVCNIIYYDIYIVDRNDGETTETFLRIDFLIDDVVFFPSRQKVIYKSASSIYFQTLDDFDHAIHSDSQTIAFNDTSKNDCMISLYWNNVILISKTKAAAVDDGSDGEIIISENPRLETNGNDIMSIVAIALSSIVAVCTFVGVIGGRLELIAHYFNRIIARRNRRVPPPPPSRLDIEMIEREPL